MPRSHRTERLEHSTLARIRRNRQHQQSTSWNRSRQYLFKNTKSMGNTDFIEQLQTAFRQKPMFPTRKVQQGRQRRVTPIFVPFSESKNGLVKLAILTAKSFPLFSSLLLALLASLVSSPVPSFLTSSLLMGLFWSVQHQTSNRTTRSTT